MGNETPKAHQTATLDLTRFITPFGSQSTAAEVIDGVNLASRRAIVTGDASGIGTETARALAGAGASVTLAVRRPDAAELVAIELRRSTAVRRRNSPNPRGHGILLARTLRGLCDRR